MRFNRWAVSATLVLAALVAPRAQAEITEDSGKFEIFTGWYFPDDMGTSENFDDLTVGLRGGYHFTQHFGMMFGVQAFQTDVEIGADELDVENWLVDVSFAWFANPEDKAVFTLFGGPGFVSRDFDFKIASALDNETDGISVHVGLGGEIQCTEHFYIRPEALVRWIDGDDGTGIDDATDWQVGLAWGWYIGNLLLRPRTAICVVRLRCRSLRRTKAYASVATPCLPSSWPSGARS